MILLVKLLLTASLVTLGSILPSRATEPIVNSLRHVGLIAQATTPAENARPSDNVGQSDAEESIDETPLLEFVEKHQQPLLKLLRFMKKKQPQQYQHALKELARVKQRLTTLEKRDSESHAIELELWQVRSNLRMLVAEILVSDKDAQQRLKKNLHELVEKELDLDIARLKLEQRRMEQRLSTIQSQLSERSENRDVVLSKAIKTWENRAFKSSPRPKKQ